MECKICYDKPLKKKIEREMQACVSCITTALNLVERLHNHYFSLVHEEDD
jgi:hypothetical protein